MPRHRSLAVQATLSCLLLFLIATGRTRGDEGEDFFEAKVRPLLVEHCYKCHGGAKTKGGLALDTRDGWVKGGDSGPALVPGRPDESRLIAAVKQDGSEASMPPDGKLPESAIAILTEWVKIGAPDPRIAPARIGGMTVDDARTWWAFQPLRSVAPPSAPPGDTGPQNGIDRFLHARLAAEGLTPTSPADRRTLIRRATYDLTGLPPSPVEVAAFENDSAPDAFARVVDRLLESPHYGERWGRHWLDVVRYADTAGENTDRPLPEMWRYRNWVFEALNRDIPFDEFIRLQIAGDLLAAPGSGVPYAEGVVATGYLALARRFGHDSDKDNHLMYEDVIDNLGKAFLGLTLSCARCHDHKYDPLTAEDYYAVYGILESSRFSFAGCEAKGAPRDLVPMLAAEEAEALKRPWRERFERGDAAVKSIEAELQSLTATVKEPPSAKTVLATGNVDEGGTVTIEATGTGPLDRIAVRKGEVLRLVVSPRGNHGADSTLVQWHIAEVGETGRRWTTDDLVPELLKGNPHPGSADTPATWLFLDLQKDLDLLAERLDGYQSHGAIKIWRRGETPSVFANASPEAVKVWTELAPRSLFVHPGPSGPVALAWVSPLDGIVSMTGRIADAHPAPGLDGIAFSIEHIATPETGQKLIRWGELSRSLAAAIQRRDAEAGPEPVVPVAFAVVDGEARNARVQLQGDPEKPGQEIPRRWLGIFGGDPVADGVGSGRRQLADWIAGHPLSTRVVVNRIWQGHFGAGLVRTVNDFGSRGERPDHPELLEWLSGEFESGGRRLKPLHRMILLSDAYRQTSQVDEATLRRDPDNRLFARFERRRLSAEELRDSLLVVSGRLDRIPGESHPFPDPKTWGFTQHNPFSAVYDNSRRTAYQMVQRQRRHPFLALFDGADPNASTGARQSTTVPTQALFFLNDPFFHAQAGALAATLHAQSDDAARLLQLFRTTLQRDPTAEEQSWAHDFLAAYPGNDDDKWAACARIVLAGNEFLNVD